MLFGLIHFPKRKKHNAIKAFQHYLAFQLGEGGEGGSLQIVK